MQSTNLLCTQLAGRSRGIGAATASYDAPTMPIASPDGTVATTITEDAQPTARGLPRSRKYRTTFASSIYGLASSSRTSSGQRALGHVIVSTGRRRRTSDRVANLGNDGVPQIGNVGAAWHGVRKRVGAQCRSGWYRRTRPQRPSEFTTRQLADRSTAAGDQLSQAMAPARRHVWGAQFETAGVGVTSYIPTAGSTVTRSQDILSLPLTSSPAGTPARAACWWRRIGCIPSSRDAMAADGAFLVGGPGVSRCRSARPRCKSARMAAASSSTAPSKASPTTRAPGPMPSCRESSR
jgi:hypothetical protein